MLWDSYLLFHRELAQVNTVFRSSDQITELAKFSLEGDFVEEFNEFDIVIGGLEVLFQEDVDAGFQDECIVDRDHTNTILLVPARLTTASDGSIHDIIGHKEEGLKLRDEQNQYLLFLFAVMPII